MKKFGSAIILAGGKSSRMGFDKQQLNIDNNRLINHLIGKLSETFEEIIVVTNTPTYYAGIDCITVQDEIVSKGPLSGIHIGLKKCKSQYAYVIACDMPHINLEYIEFMMCKIGKVERDACVTLFKQEWIEPFNAFYSKSIIKEIEKYLLGGKKSVYHLLKELKTLYIDEGIARDYSKNWEMFLNLNTKEDLEEFINTNINNSSIG